MWLCVLVSLFLLVDINIALHESQNFVLKPSKRECFFEDVEKVNSASRIDVFIQAGGNVDVIINIYGPLSLSKIRSNDFEGPIFSERVNVAKEALTETHTFSTDFKPTEIGTYALCLDNRHSRFMPKMVQLDITPYEILETIEADNENELPPVPVGNKDDKSGDSTTTTLVYSISLLNMIHKGINKIQLQQQRDRHRLILHSESNKNNYDKAFYGSIIETVIFICVAIFQIFFVRQWFATRNVGKAKNWT